MVDTIKWRDVLSEVLNAMALLGWVKLYVNSIRFYNTWKELIMPITKKPETFEEVIVVQLFTTMPLDVDSYVSATNYARVSIDKLDIIDESDIIDAVCVVDRTNEKKLTMDTKEVLTRYKDDSSGCCTAVKIINGRYSRCCIDDGHTGPHKSGCGSWTDDYKQHEPQERIKHG